MKILFVSSSIHLEDQGQGHQVSNSQDLIEINTCIWFKFEGKIPNDSKVMAFIRNLKQKELKTIRLPPSDTCLRTI